MSSRLRQVSPQELQSDSLNRLTMQLDTYSFCQFCTAERCEPPCSSASGLGSSCSTCRCPTTPETTSRPPLPPCEPLSCGSTCSTGVWMTVTPTWAPGACAWCSCSQTPPPATCTYPIPDCPLGTECALNPGCTRSYGVWTTGYAPGSSCPTCTCQRNVVCSPAPCNGPCSTGSLQYDYGNACALCPGCACSTTTATPCKPMTDCWGMCGGGTLSVSTVTQCSRSCSEYCVCHTTTMDGISGGANMSGIDGDLPPTPALTGTAAAET